MFVALKPFPYAHNRHDVRLVSEGDILPIDDSVVDGLMAEGFIREATAEESDSAQVGPVVLDAPVEIPADWQKLNGPQLARLAASLNGGPVKGKAAQLAVVKSAVAERAA